MLRNIREVYSVRQGNKTLSVAFQDRLYACGFTSRLQCAKVKHNVLPEPKVVLMPGERAQLKAERLQQIGLDIDQPLDVDVHSSLFVPKFNGDPMNPLNNGGYHIHTSKTEEFMMYPIRKGLGIVLAYEMLVEDNHEMVLRCVVIHPSGSVKSFSISDMM